MNLQVGQRLWYVSRDSRYSTNREVEVTRLGRKWAYLDGNERCRIDIETLTVDGGEYISPGRCYLSREEYEAERVLYSAWGRLQRDLRDHDRSPEGVTLEDIKQARALLRLEEK